MNARVRFAEAIILCICMFQFRSLVMHTPR